MENSSQRTTQKYICFTKMQFITYYRHIPAYAITLDIPQQELAIIKYSLETGDILDSKGCYKNVRRLVNIMEYCMSDDLKKTVKALREYVNVEYKGKNSTVVLAAPSYGNPEYLRVYMNGGNIGKFSLVPGKLSTGISGAYSHKCTEPVPNCVKELSAKKHQRKDVLKIMPPHSRDFSRVRFTY